MKDWTEPVIPLADELSIPQRMMACVDIYQALTESRPYKQGMSHEKTRHILQDMSDKGWLDPGIVQQVMKCFGSDASL